MPQKIKLLVIGGSEDSGSLDGSPELRDILKTLPKEVEYEIVSVREEKDAASTASFINKGSFDVVMFAKTVTQSPWQITDLCASQEPQAKLPVFYIDGKIEHVLDREFKAAEFTGAAGIVKRDGDKTEFEFKHAYQYANPHPDCHVSNELSTQFNIASITKMLTSIAIAKLIEEGKLALDTPIYESLLKTDCDLFYKEIFKKAPWITPRQLLSHTSGLEDNIAGVFEENFGPQQISFASARDYITHCASLDKQTFIKRGTIQYSNYGFDLLGFAVEALTGNFYQYLKDNVFDSAGMSHTVPLREPGADFAVPQVKITTIPNVPALSDMRQDKDQEIKQLAETANNILTYAKAFTPNLEAVTRLVNEYSRGLLQCTPNDFPAFKEKIKKEIETVFSAFTSQDYTGSSSR